jgi:hypothetical protein
VNDRVAMNSVVHLADRLEQAAENERTYKGEGYAGPEMVREAAAMLRDQHGWLYAVWMAFLSDEATHELEQVLRNLSAWMSEQEAK